MSYEEMPLKLNETEVSFTYHHIKSLYVKVYLMKKLFLTLIAAMTLVANTVFATEQTNTTTADANPPATSATNDNKEIGSEAQKETKKKKKKKKKNKKAKSQKSEENNNTATPAQPATLPAAE